MKFTTAIAATIIGLSSVSALPTKSTPTANEIVPEAISIYYVWSGEIDYDVSEGRIIKTQTSSDLTTLATFDFDSIPAGSTCTLVFETDTSYVIEDNHQFDVFQADHIVTADQSTWPTSSQRQLPLGRLQAVEEGLAVIVPDVAGQGFTFPCPTGKRAYEFVPTGDKSTITWTEEFDGPYIQWS